MLWKEIEACQERSNERISSSLATAWKEIKQGGRNSLTCLTVKKEEGEGDGIGCLPLVVSGMLTGLTQTDRDSPSIYEIAPTYPFFALCTGRKNRITNRYSTATVLRMTDHIRFILTSLSSPSMKVHDDSVQSALFGDDTVSN
ncbi:hypothetical protein SAY86_019447 [Trapa natans]|uniref:Uncharacterized protein n=1 Tax=Trapa natans TaxID=22666 RepID=A0AAN7LHA8_TRANT|nr:hypothetical protein SAY86_019447 [Trapa natans]